MKTLIPGMMNLFHAGESSARVMFAATTLAARARGDSAAAAEAGEVVGIDHARTHVANQQWKEMSGWRLSCSAAKMAKVFYTAF